METKTINVSGVELLLEKRICKGGCQRVLWVQPSSLDHYARRDCQATCGKKIDEIPTEILSRYDEFGRESFQKEDKTRNDVKKKKSEKKLLEKMSKASKKEMLVLKKAQEKELLLIQWNSVVEKGKHIYEQRDKIADYRDKISSLAETCISKKKFFSIVQFSIAIGVDRKTLHTWILTKQEVINNLKDYDGDFMAAKKVRDRLSKDASILDQSSLDQLYFEEKRKVDLSKRSKADKKAKERKPKKKKENTSDLSSNVINHDFKNQHLKVKVPQNLKFRFKLTG